MADLSGLILASLRERGAIHEEKGINPEGYAALQLAYLGDTVFDLYVRSRLVMGTNDSMKQLHFTASSIVNAHSQSRAITRLIPELSEEEERVVKHARNHKALTVPKNMSVGDYKWATGFEALIGYLYLSEQNERLLWLLERAWDVINEESGDSEHE